jgi:hypothetical protein
MIDNAADTGGQCLVSLEINISHRYRTGQIGVFEFRIRNAGARTLQALGLMVECPCQISRKKSVTLKNIASSSEKRPYFQFEPSRGGEALLEIELVAEDDARLLQVYRGQTSVSISSENDGPTSPTSFNINIHDIQKLMGNDLSGLMTIAGKELSEDRLRERMERREPLWMRIDLDLDEQETLQRRAAKREVVLVPGGQPTLRTAKAILESLDPANPRRLFLYSTPEIRFGRNAQKSDAVLRFLPDFYNDERSKTISGEQFVVRYSSGACSLSLVAQGHASMFWDGRAVGRDEQIPLASGSAITIGTHELTLKVSCVAAGADPQWNPTREAIIRLDPGDDCFKDCPWDLVTFARKMNGEEESYLWLFRKMDLGWAEDGAAGLEAGATVNPRARLSFWNGRYYLEPLGGELQVQTVLIQAGQIACLGPSADVAFGPCRFRWKLLGPAQNIS